jgi:DNA (cytosine-5)-methyltransferase 1
MTLRVLSLFSGAGGADLALEAAGMTVAALCEIEPHARAVLRHHWPDVPLHGDVSELDGTQYKGKVDIVVGGSPCQDLSVAGKRAGLTEGSGTRSSLFYEQVRVWNETESPYLIWENVKGAFSSAQGADFGAVLSALVGRPVPVPRDGWTNGGVVAGPAAVAAWRLLDLQYFGVPQRRERIVVLASRAGGVDPAEVLALGQSVSRDHPPRFQAREGATPTAVASVDREVAAVSITYDARGNGDGQVTNTLAGDHQNRVTDYTALVLNTQQATAFHLTQDPINGPVSPALGVTSHGMGVVIPIDTRNATRTTEKSEQNRQGVGIGENGDPSPTLTGLFTPAVFQQDRIVAPTLTAANDPSRSPQSSEVTAQVSAILHAESAPTLAFKIRGGVEVDSAGKSAGKGYLGSEEMAFTLGVSQDQHIHQPAFRMVAFGEYAEDGTASAIKARDFKDATDLTLVSPGVPRRLMPSECEALMGWPRNHTKYGVNEKGVRYELADTPRYKLCGNGWGKEWGEWFFRRLREAEEST